MAKGGRGGKRGAAGGGAVDAETREIEKSLENINGYTIKTANGETLQYFFTERNGTTWYKNDINGMFAPMPGNLTEKQLISNAKSRGNSVSEIPLSEMVESVKKYRKNRNEMDKFLTQNDVKNISAQKGTRMIRLAGNAGRRGV